MPELPEVETVKRGLMPYMTEAKIEDIALSGKKLRFPLPRNFAARLKGEEITHFNRRAKYLLCHLASDQVLVMHMGMSGKFIINEQFPQHHNSKHDHVIFGLSNGNSIIYHDPRRFGFMSLIKEKDLEHHKFFHQLGPEPTGNAFHEEHLAGKAKDKKTALKNFLLDQRVVAGLGNIYVLEALFRARLSPMKPAGILCNKKGLATKAGSKLVPAIKAVLEEAIKAGGSSLKDYAQADGELGYFQHQFKVYGRSGQNCLRGNCRGEIKRVIQGGRSSFFCPKCQK